MLTALDVKKHCDLADTGSHTVKPTLYGLTTDHYTFDSGNYVSSARRR